MAKILIIEDLQEVRDLLSIFLSKKGFEVLSASSGKEGIDLTRGVSPDLVLLDVNMPDLDGIEVLKKIRDFDKKIKVVMLSGLDTAELEEKARLAGATAFLSKSQGIEAIAKKVSEL